MNNKIKKEKFVSIKNHSCKKCGGKDIAVFYHKDYKMCSFSHICRLEIEGEHLLKHCRICGYEWVTKVKK